MHRSALLIAILLLSACTQRPVKPSTESFDWLSGCWELQRSDGTAYEEMWLPATKDGTVGVAREIRDGRTVSYEYERIELRANGSLVFLAQPAGQEPTPFNMVEHAGGTLAFENPQHDFPTRIEYRFVDLNALHARVSGAGGARAIDYPMHRRDCQG